MLITEEQIDLLADTISSACNNDIVKLIRGRDKQGWIAGVAGLEAEGLTVALALQELKDKIIKQLEQNWIDSVSREAEARQKLDLLKKL